ncbi:hypothetical protein POM88_028706 [Heracleum sosnowskyi]|uniref:Elongation factor G-like domain-containing protein n=1 Tax=Heracleum sosnowskyi TaxID=360622 RepID=A0AAD8MHV4_9APIA|nr:hypothetical protein POM88_028706 [Heracleum sosnowskyi]
MAKAGKKFVVLRSIASGFLLIGYVIVYAERGLKQETAGYNQTPKHIAEMNYLLRVVNFLWQKGQQVIDAGLDKSKGPVATFIVQKGTLKKGDTIVFGEAFGKGLSKTISMAAHILDSVVSFNDRSFTKFWSTSSETEKEDQHTYTNYIWNCFRDSYGSHHPHLYDFMRML